MKKLLIEMSGAVSTPWLAAGTVTTIVYVLFITLPIVGLVGYAITQGGLTQAIMNPLVLQALRLSLVTSTVAIVIMASFGTPLAYLLARGKVPGGRVLEIAVELPLVLPPVVAGFALLMAFGRQGIVGQHLDSLGISLPFTGIAVILAQLFVSTPFFLRAARLGFQSTDVTLEHIAQTLGEPAWRAFFRVSLPLAMPSIIGGLTLAWIRALSEFGATLIFAGNLPGQTQTMPLAILSALEMGLAESLALSLLLGGVAISLAIILSVAGQRARVIR